MADVTIRVDYDDLNEAKRQADDLFQSIQRLNGTSVRSPFGQMSHDLSLVTSGMSVLLDQFSSLSQFTSDFANGIGEAFSSMSNLFKTDIVRYATASLTHQFMQSLVGNLQNVTARYDILSTFVPYMNLAGVDSATAQALQDRINQSILGLPIGLDEATQRFRRYNMYLNDPEAAANLTIGIQNAIMAGGSGEAYRNQAYNMIERMLATGTLTNIRQWQSLMVGLGVSQKYIEQELGLPQGTLLENIKAKTVSVDEFLAALERLGTGATDAAKGLNEALDIYKSTLESWLSNIEFAVTRGNENVLRAFNETLEIVSGKGITDYMKDYRDFLDSLFGGASDYIRNNPERIQQALDMVTKVLDTLGRFSVSGTFENVLDYLQILSDIVTSLFSQIPPGELEQFVAFATTLAGPLGSLFSAVSSGGPAMVAVFERFKEFKFDTLVDSIVKNADTMAKFIESILNLFSDEQLSEIIAFGLVWGKPVAAALAAISAALSTFATVKVIQGMSALADLGKLVGGTSGAAGMGLLGSLGATAGIAVGGTALLALLGISMDNAHLSTEAAKYNGTDAELMAEITRLKYDLQNPYDEMGYEESWVAGTRDRLRVLESVATARGIGGYGTNQITGDIEYNGKVETGMDKLRTFSNTLSEVPSLFDKAAKAAEQFVDKETEVFGKANETLADVIERNKEEAAKFGEYTEAVNALMQFVTPENASLIMELTQGGVDNLEQIQNVVEELEKNPDALDPLIDALGELEDATDESKIAFEELQLTISLMANYGFTEGEVAALNIAAGLRAGQSAAVQAAAELAAAVKRQLGYITDWTSITALRYSDYESQPTAYWDSKNKKWVYKANGGLIYASNGWFIPRGTDTVPAMLTPGEFVMRKAAVDTFGAAFMKSINDLNIGAAFDRLINTKLSNPRGYVNNTYNNRDDHSTHIQNIKTNNPYFANRRAGRFVRAMA